MHMLMVHSYKGGSGKTSYAYFLAKTLSKNNRVLLIEADFNGPVLSKINNITPNKPDVFFNEYLKNEDKPIDYYIYPNLENNLGIIYCSPDINPFEKILSNEQGWYKQQNQRIMKDLSNLDYDYIIFDIEPGISMFAITIFNICDLIHIILRPDYYSVEGTEILFKEYYTKIDRIKSKEVSIIFNQIPINDELDDLINRWKIRFELLIPELTTRTITYDNSVIINLAKGVFQLDQESGFLQSIQHIAEEL